MINNNNIGNEKSNHMPNLLTKVVPQAKINLVKQINLVSNTNDKDKSPHNSNNNLIMSLWSQTPTRSTITNNTNTVSNSNSNEIINDY